MEPRTGITFSRGGGTIGEALPPIEVHTPRSLHYPHIRNSHESPNMQLAPPPGKFPEVSPGLLEISEKSGDTQAWIKFAL